VDSTFHHNYSLNSKETLNNSDHSYFITHCSHDTSIESEELFIKDGNPRCFSFAILPSTQCILILNDMLPTISESTVHRYPLHKTCFSPCSVGENFSSTHKQWATVCVLLSSLTQAKKQPYSNKVLNENIIKNTIDIT